MNSVSWIVWHISDRNAGLKWLRVLGRWISQIHRSRIPGQSAFWWCQSVASIQGSSVFSKTCTHPREIKHSKWKSLTGWFFSPSYKLCRGFSSHIWWHQTVRVCRFPPGQRCRTLRRHSATWSTMFAPQRHFGGDDPPRCVRRGWGILSMGMQRDFMQWLR
jgi:hypothetical protein